MEQRTYSLEEFEKLGSLDEKIAFLSQNAKYILNQQKATDIDYKAKILEYKPVVTSEQHIVDIPKNVVPKLEQNLSKKASENKISDEKKINYFIFLKEKPIITVPSFIISDLKETFKDHTKFIRDIFNSLSSKARDAFTITEEDERLDNIALADKLQEKERKRIVKARKADFKFALKQERLALKRAKKLRLKLKRRQVIAKSKAYIATIPKANLKLLKDNLQLKYGLWYENHLEKLDNIKRIKAIKVADMLQEEENNLRRKKAIEDMIAALKAQDEVTRTSSVRISR